MAAEVVIGRHGCIGACDTDLKKAIAIGPDQALTTLEESGYDLTDEQVQGFPISGPRALARIIIIAQCLDNLDEYENACASAQCNGCRLTIGPV